MYSVGIETLVGWIKKSNMPTLFRERVIITNGHRPQPNGSMGPYGSYGSHSSYDGSGSYGLYGTSGADDRKGLPSHYLLIKDFES